MNDKQLLGQRGRAPQRLAVLKVAHANPADLSSGILMADFFPRAETVRCPWTAVPAALVTTVGPA